MNSPNTDLYTDKTVDFTEISEAFNPPERLFVFPEQDSFDPVDLGLLVSQRPPDKTDGSMDAEMTDAYPEPPPLAPAAW